MIKIKHSEATRIGIDARRLSFKNVSEKKNYQIDEKIKTVKNTDLTQTKYPARQPQKTTRNHAPLLIAMLIAVQPGRVKSQNNTQAGQVIMPRPGSHSQATTVMKPVINKQVNITPNVNKKGDYQSRGRHGLSSLKEVEQRHDKKRYGRSERISPPHVYRKKGQKLSHKKNALELSEDFSLLLRVKKDTSNQYAGRGSGYGSGPQRTDKSALNPAKIPPIVYDQNNMYIPPVNDKVTTDKFPICLSRNVSSLANESIALPYGELESHAWSTSDINWNNKIAEYYILSTQKETIRLLGLNAWITENTEIDVKLILAAFINIFKRDALFDSYNFVIDSYEYSILINTMFRDMECVEEKEKLINELISMTNRGYWVSTIFYKAINDADSTLLLPSINSFYQSLNKDTPINALSLFHYRELSKLNEFRADSSSYTGVIKSLNDNEFAALKHLFNSQILETFPLAVGLMEDSSIDGVYGKMTRPNDYLLFSVEGFLLNFGAVCAQEFGLDVSVFEQPQMLQYIAIRTLLDLAPPLWPHNSEKLFTAYFQANSDALEKELSSSFYYTVIGFMLLMSDLVTFYTKAYNLVNALKTFSEGIHQFNATTFTEEKFNKLSNALSIEIYKYCQYNLYSMTAPERKFIEVAISDKDSTVKILKLMLNWRVNNEENKMSLGSLLTVQNADDSIFRAYLLSPSIISSNLVSPGLIRLPNAMYVDNDVNKIVSRHQSYFSEVFNSMEILSKQSKSFNFSLADERILPPEISEEKKWITAVANFTAGELKGIAEEGEMLRHAFTHRRNMPNTEQSSMLKDVVVNIASFIPFSSCIWAAFDLNKILPMVEEPKPVVVDNKDTVVDLALNSLGCTADFISMGSSTAFNDIVKAINRIKEGLTEKLYAKTSKEFLKEAFSLKNRESDKTAQMALFKDEPLLMKHIMKKEFYHKPPQKLLPKDIPSDYIYSGTLVDNPTSSIVIGFMFKGEMKMYAIDPVSKVLTRKSARFERENQGSWMVDAEIEVRSNEFIRNIDRWDGYYAAVMKDVEFTRLEGYAIENSAFNSIYPTTHEVVDKPGLYGIEMSETLFLKRKDVYLRVKKTAEENVYTVVAENAPNDLYINIKFEAAVGLNVISNNLIKVKRPEEIMGDLIKMDSSENPYFIDDVILARLTPAGSYQMELVSVSLSPYNYKDKLIIMLKDNNDGLHYRLGPNKDGEFTPLPAEEKSTLTELCRVTRGLTDSEPGCSHWTAVTLSPSKKNSQRHRDLDDVYKSKLEYMNRIPATWDMMEWLQRLDHFSNDAAKSGVIRKYCHEEGAKNLEKLGVNDVVDKINLVEFLGISNFNDNFESLTMSELEKIRRFWNEAAYHLKHDNKNDDRIFASDAANELAEIANGLASASFLFDGELYHDYSMLRMEYIDKYKFNEEAIASILWSRRVSKGTLENKEVRLKPFIKFNVEDDRLIYQKGQDWYGVVYGPATAEDFRAKYPVQSKSISDAVKQIRDIGKAFKKEKSQLWGFFYQYTHISKNSLSKEMQGNIELIFKRVYKASKNFEEKNIIPFKEVSKKSLPVSLLNSYDKERFVFDNHIFGFTTQQNAKIYFGINNVQEGESLLNTVLHELAHNVGGPGLGHIEIYFRDGEHFLSPTRRDSPSRRGELLSKSPRAFAYFVARSAHTFNSYLFKLKQSLLHELELKIESLAETNSANRFFFPSWKKNLEVLTAGGGGLRSPIALRINEIKTLLGSIDGVNQPHKTLNIENKKLIQKTVDFIYAPGNEEHLVNVLVMNPDFISAFMQYVALDSAQKPRSSKRVVRSTDNAVSNNTAIISNEIISNIAELLMSDLLLNPPEQGCVEPEVTPPMEIRVFGH
ncbi:hypothetical protein ASE93_09925 [Serratia sp. Leaf50]|nr:hypothetical protein ASE93_09925 [Serratia sp. Leaf50]